MPKTSTNVANRGAILVIALTAAGVAAASVAIWYQHRQTRGALALWGAAVAQRIERATTVELIEFDHGSHAESGGMAGTFDARRAIDISHARGVLHFRRSLLQDANFVWQSQAEAAVSDSDWDYAARFADDDGSVVLMFELDRGMVANLAAPGKIALFTDRMSQGLTRFLQELTANAEPER